MLKRQKSVENEMSVETIVHGLSKDGDCVTHSRWHGKLGLEEPLAASLARKGSPLEALVLSISCE